MIKQQENIKKTSLSHTLSEYFTCTQASLVGGAFLPHILYKDGVHGLQATPMELYMRHREDTMKEKYN